MLLPLTTLLRMATVILLIGFSAYSSAARVDVLFVYDEGVEQGWSPETLGRSLINEGNIIYANSNVDIQLYFAGTYKKDFDFSDTNNNGKINRVRRQFEIQTERNRVSADIVVYLTNDTLEGFCGWAFIDVNERFAYSLQKPGCGAILFVHELGHNMGLQHARRQLGSVGSGGTLPHLDYGWGYGVDNSFSTIMGYPESFSAPNYLARFSDPTATCLGLPCGKPISNSESAYSVRALNQVKETVSAYRVRTRDQLAFDLPAKIEAEDYFKGRDDTPGNQNAITDCQYRGFDVDVENSADDDTCNIGWTSASEEVSYRIGKASGIYDVTLRVSTRFENRRLWLTVDGRLAEEFVVSGSSWTAYKSITAYDIFIPSGAELGLRWINGNVNVNYLDVRDAVYSVLPVTNDAYIRDGIFADSVFSQVQGLVVKTGTVDTSRKAVFRIRRNQITEPVSQAKLRFRIRTAQPVAETLVAVVRPIIDNWNDSNVTWNRIGEPGDILAPVFVRPKGAWLDVDITDYFNSEVGQDFTSFAIANRFEGTDTYWAIFSNESRYIPEMVIVP